MKPTPTAEAPDLAWPRPRPFIVIAVMCLFAAGLFRSVSQPWVGMHEWNGAYYSYVSYNLLRYPPSESHLLPVVEFGPPQSRVNTDASTASAETAPRDIQRYATHPPGLAWLLAAAFAMGGKSEFVARLPMIAASLASCWLLMRILSSTLGRVVGMIGGVLYASMPMTVFFGRMVNHEPVCQFFMLLSLWGWLVACGDVASYQSRRVGNVTWIVGLTGAIWIDWPGVIFAGAMALHAIVLFRSGRISRNTLVTAFVLPAVVTVAAFSWLVYGGMDGHWSALRDMAFSRSGTDATDVLHNRDRSMGDRNAWEFTRDNFGLLLLVLAAVGSAIIASRWRSGLPIRAERGRRVTFAGLMIPLAVGTIWLVVFWRQFQHHNYWQFYLAPAAAALAAVAIVRLHDQLAVLLPRMAESLSVSLLASVVIGGLLGCDDFFQRRSFSPELISDWKQVVSATEPTDRLMLFEPFEDVDIRGSYHYRNLTPPHLPYYLDRNVVSPPPNATVDTLQHVASALLIRVDVAQPGSGRPGDLLIRELRRTGHRMIFRQSLVIVDFEPDRNRPF